MAPDRLRSRIADQFSYRSERADIWRAFDLVLETDAYLNLGYSRWYQPHVWGSSQRRLVSLVGEHLAKAVGVTAGTHLLDVGCGRGGPAAQLRRTYGFDVTGIDLVRYNVERARTGTATDLRGPSFVVGDASRLPFRPGSFGACTAIDTLVYLPDRSRVFEQLANALAPGGYLVLTDLVRRRDLTDTEHDRVGAFADAWDMPPPGTAEEYVDAIEEVGLECLEAEDLSPHSVGRFRRWTSLFEWVVASPLRPLLDALLRRWDLDPVTLVDQVRRAHRALPALEHVLIVARNPA
jgi:MPBQ/MSBQ methyltransferase